MRGLCRAPVFWIVLLITSLVRLSPVVHSHEWTERSRGAFIKNVSRQRTIHRQHFRRTTLVSPVHHTIQGMQCIEVKVDLPLVGTVTILEATADTQEELVNLALDEASSLDCKLASGDPYGAVLWPAASAIASHLLIHKDSLLRNKIILEIGTGTGLVALAASLGGAQRVLATDYESIPLELLKYAATLNSVPSTILDTQLLDLCDSQAPLPLADVVVAADIMYEPKTGRAMALRTLEALKSGAKVIIGDSPGRAGRPAFLQALEELGVVDANFQDTRGTTVTGERHNLICGPTSVTVSQQPQELTVAIMELNSENLLA